MPIGVPKVPFRLPGEPSAQWLTYITDYIAGFVGMLGWVAHNPQRDAQAAQSRHQPSAASAHTRAGESRGAAQLRVVRMGNACAAGRGLGSC